jgi:hypothetical protein
VHSSQSGLNQVSSKVISVEQLLVWLESTGRMNLYERDKAAVDVNEWKVLVYLKAIAHLL